MCHSVCVSVAGIRLRWCNPSPFFINHSQFDRAKCTKTWMERQFKCAWEDGSSKSKSARVANSISLKWFHAANIAFIFSRMPESIWIGFWDDINWNANANRFRWCLRDAVVVLVCQHRIVTRISLVGIWYNWSDGGISYGRLTMRIEMMTFVQSDF